MLSSTLVLALAIRACADITVAQGTDDLPPVSQRSDDPTVVTPLAVFRGSRMTSRRGRAFEAYRGMPYAKPPVGELRFQPPVPIVQHQGTVDASSEGPACPQLAPVGYDINEDCLRMNVYTPNSKSAKPLPVIFYIHAGGFYSMSGRSDLFGPEYLLDKDLVLVTINYRISTLGFLSTGDELAPGNNGLKDQVLALKWVQRNIAAFGGDPGCVTIAGCSAGASSVMMHMISPMSKGLFHRGISMSGTPVDKSYNPRDLYPLAVRQAQLVNCPTNTSKAIFDCLKEKPWKELADSFLGFYEFGFDPVAFFPPVVEKDFGQERFLPIQPIDAIREGRFHAVPWIISQTKDEFFWLAFNTLRNETLRKTMDAEWERIAPISLILPREEAAEPTRRLRCQYLGDRRLEDDVPTRRDLGRLYADAVTGFPVHRNANLMCRRSPQPVYYYEFDYMGNHSFYENRTTGRPIGVAHHDDLIYLFTMSYRFPAIGTAAPDGHMVDKMTAIWYNFARYGDPNPRGHEQPELASLCWPRMKPKDRRYLRLGEPFSVHTNLYEDRFQLWEQLYPIKY